MVNALQKQPRNDGSQHSIQAIYSSRTWAYIPWGMVILLVGVGLVLLSGQTDFTPTLFSKERDLSFYFIKRNIKDDICLKTLKIFFFYE